MTVVCVGAGCCPLPPWGPAGCGCLEKGVGVFVFSVCQAFGEGFCSPELFFVLTYGNVDPLAKILVISYASRQGTLPRGYLRAPCYLQSGLNSPGQSLWGAAQV